MSGSGFWTISGKVVEGAGEAVHFTQLDWVQSQCQSKLGFAPYPGTLNLQVDLIDWHRHIDPFIPMMVDLMPPDSSCCSAQALPVTINGIAAAIIIPEEKVRIHTESIVEILAPVHLKTALSVKSGDTVIIAVGPEYESTG